MIVSHSESLFRDQDSENSWHGGALMVRFACYVGRAMSGKKNYDATKKLPEGEPTQELPGGTKVGLPKREEVFAALRKVARKPAK